MTQSPENNEHSTKPVFKTKSFVANKPNEPLWKMNFKYIKISVKILLQTMSVVLGCS